jgi:hypothetical protein
MIKPFMLSVFTPVLLEAPVSSFEKSLPYKNRLFRVDLQREGGRPVGVSITYNKNYVPQLVLLDETLTYPIPKYPSPTTAFFRFTSEGDNVQIQFEGLPKRWAYMLSDFAGMDDIKVTERPLERADAPAVGEKGPYPLYRKQIDIEEEIDPELATLGDEDRLFKMAPTHWTSPTPVCLKIDDDRWETYDGEFSKYTDLVLSKVGGKYRSLGRTPNPYSRLYAAEGGLLFRNKYVSEWIAFHHRYGSIRNETKGRTYYHTRDDITPEELIVLEEVLKKEGVKVAEYPALYELD